MAIVVWTVQKAPALPTPSAPAIAELPAVKEFLRTENNVLRIYFNQVDASNTAALNAAIDLQAQIEYEEIMGWVLS